MKIKYLLAAGLMALPFSFPNSAQAREYCREYTKTIRVGGQMESGYGTACLQPDGAWEIVSTRGSVDPDEMYEYIHESLTRRDRDVVVISDRRHYGHHYRPHNRYAYAYRMPPGHYKHGHKKHYKHKHHKHNKHTAYRHGRHDGHYDRRYDHRDNGVSVFFKF